MKNVIGLIFLRSCVSATSEMIERPVRSKILTLLQMMEREPTVSCDALVSAITEEFPELSVDYVRQFVRQAKLSLYDHSHVPVWFHDLHLTVTEPSIEEILSASGELEFSRRSESDWMSISNAWRKFCIANWHRPQHEKCCEFDPSSNCYRLTRLGFQNMLMAVSFRVYDRVRGALESTNPTSSTLDTL